MHAESWEMNQWKLNILLHHAAQYSPSMEEHIASSHRELTDVHNDLNYLSMQIEIAL